MTSVAFWLVNRYPLACRAALSSSWFSMMPLCTRATRPSASPALPCASPALPCASPARPAASRALPAVAPACPRPWLKWGWALCCAGAPWVALRVWAMPVEMGERGGGGVVRRRTMGGPAGVGSAGGAVDMLGLHLLQQLGHAGCAAGALQARATVRRMAAGGMHGHAAGGIAPVFQPLQALDENGNDVARGDRADDAAHGGCLLGGKRW